MTILMDPTLVVAAIPLAGAALGVLFLRTPRVVQALALTAALLDLLVLGLSLESLRGPGGKTILMGLFILGGLLSTLGRDPQRGTPVDLVLMLSFLGFGLGFLSGTAGLPLFWMGGLLGLLMLTILREGGPRDAALYGAVVLAGAGLLCLLTGLSGSEPLATHARVLGLALLLPLFPVHGLFTLSLSRLPGVLPSFLGIGLPLLGFHGAWPLLAHLPAVSLKALALLALATAGFGALKALAQSSVEGRVAYAQVAYLGILWWFGASTQSATGATAAVATQVGLFFLCAVTLAMYGLLLAASQLQARFGTCTVEQLGGLARPMPRFATLLTLLITAAMGLPLFALFSAFMAIALFVAGASPGSLLVLLVTWLLASWQFPQFLQLILFGKPRADLLYQDLRHKEILPLVIVLVLLVLAGLAPSTVFELGRPTDLDSSIMTQDLPPAWHKVLMWTR
jgi:NADH-quinone oxidoreductase subunit M